jgi:hypothetical protein
MGGGESGMGGAAMLLRSRPARRCFGAGVLYSWQPCYQKRQRLATLTSSFLRANHILPFYIVPFYSLLRR